MVCLAVVASAFATLVTARRRDHGDCYVRLGRWDSYGGGSGSGGWSRRRYRNNQGLVIEDSSSSILAFKSSALESGPYEPNTAGTTGRHCSRRSFSSSPPGSVESSSSTTVSSFSSSAAATHHPTATNRLDDDDADVNDEKATGAFVDEEASSEDEYYTPVRLRHCLSQPLIETGAWERLKGDEFVLDQQTDRGDSTVGVPNLLDRFTAMCQQVATTRTSNKSSSSEWIDWQVHGKHGDVKDGSINIWVGRACHRDYQGSHLPIIKSQSIVPLTPRELAELLLDSTRVQTYNKWSLGRTDVWVKDALTKIVKNRTKPPVGSKPLVSITLMHARPVVVHNPSSAATALPSTVPPDHDDGAAWIAVSRAIGGTQFCDSADADCGRSDILLGINLLEPHGDDESLVTAITHVQTSIVPTLLAEKLGVKGAIHFVKDLRALRTKIPA